MISQGILIIGFLAWGVILVTGVLLVALNTNREFPAPVFTTGIVFLIVDTVVAILFITIVIIKRCCPSDSERT